MKGVLDSISAEIHLVAGWHDIFLPEQLDDYTRLKNTGKNPHLTVGKWHHMDQGLIGHSIRAGLDWFDSRLKQRALLSTSVTVFVQGANEWKSLESWAS